MAVLENSSQQTGVQLLHKPASIDEHLKQFVQIILLLGLEKLLESLFTSQRLHDDLDCARELLTVSIRFVSGPQIHVGRPLLPQLVQGIQDGGLSERAELQHGKIFNVVVVDLS